MVTPPASSVSLPPPPPAMGLANGVDGVDDAGKARKNGAISGTVRKEVAESIRVNLCCLSRGALVSVVFRVVGPRRWLSLLPREWRFHAHAQTSPTPRAWLV